MLFSTHDTRDGPDQHVNTFLSLRTVVQEGKYGSAGTKQCEVRTEFTVKANTLCLRRLTCQNVLATVTCRDGNDGPFGNLHRTIALNDIFTIFLLSSEMIVKHLHMY